MSLVTLFSLPIADTLPSDRQLLASILDVGDAIAAPLTSAVPQTEAHTVSEDMFKKDLIKTEAVNRFFRDTVRDLIRLYSGANYSDEAVSVLENQGVKELQSLSQKLDILEDKVNSFTDLQLAYNSGFDVFKRSSFIRSSPLNIDPAAVEGKPVFYDSKAQYATLQLQSQDDLLHSPYGQIANNVVIDYQIGLPIYDFSALRTPEHALDNSNNSFWGEVVLTDSPLLEMWPSPTSIYQPAVDMGAINQVTEGALSEYAIYFDSPETFNYITIKPYCNLPINIAAIFVIKAKQATTNSGEVLIQDIDERFSLYVINEYNSQRINGYLFINGSTYLSFPNQSDVTKLVIVFHQPHFTKDIFSLPKRLIDYNNMWQYMLGNRSNPVNGLDMTFELTNPAKILNNVSKALFVTKDNPEVDFVKYQYVYGAYSIGVYNRNYAETGILYSHKYKTDINLISGGVVAEYDIPMESATIAAENWFGPSELIPTSYNVAAAVVNYDLSYADNTNWIPLASLADDTVFEAFILSEDDEDATAIPLRLQARPGTTAYISSFDGVGGVTLLGVAIAPPIIINTPTLLQLPDFVQLSAPGFYVVEYTPMDTSYEVDFIDPDGIDSASYMEKVSFKAKLKDEFLIEKMTGLKLPSVPYINPAKTGHNLEPNGLYPKEHVPMIVEITHLDLIFTNHNTHKKEHIHTIKQTTEHKKNLHAVIHIVGETLSTTDPNPEAATHFYAAHDDWDDHGGHFPQLFELDSKGNLNPIAQIDQNGKAVWVPKPKEGEIHFVNGNSGVAGQVVLNYWYTDKHAYKHPVIINMTNYSRPKVHTMREFDIDKYPIVEYIQDGDTLYFNWDIPHSAKVHVSYHRLYDSMTLRAELIRVDPVNESVTPVIHAFTLLGRDANITSQKVIDNLSVTWSDIRYYSLGTKIQPNPLINIINQPQLLNSDQAGSPIFQSLLNPNPQNAQQFNQDINPNDGQQVLSQLVSFDWFQIVNCGPIEETISAMYDSTQTAVYIDLTNAEYIVPDNNFTYGINYINLFGDGSNSFTLEGGQSCIVGIANLYQPPNTPNSISPVTIYSSAPASSYLDGPEWDIFALPAQPGSSSVQFVLS